jgi:hypothetical protein
VLLVVLWLVTAGLWYATQGQATVHKKEYEAAAAARDKASEERDAARKEQVELSKVVGFTSPNTINPISDSKAIQSEIEGVKSDLGKGGGGAESMTSLSAAITALRGAYKSSQEQLTSLKADLDKELAARRAADGNVTAVETTYKDQITKLNQELQDSNQRADNQSKTDSKRFDELLAAQASSDAAARQAQQALAEFEVQSKRDVGTRDATIKALALRREPMAPEDIDGHVLSVGAGGGMAYIDLGSRDGLKRGTRFEVLRPGKGGDMAKLGTVEVRDVENDMALVALVGEPDAFDPIVKGDAIRNPHFEKGRVLHYYLLGQFPLTLSKDFVTTRLRELGAEVDDKLGTGTDVLVLGDKDLSEGEAAKELTETDEYLLADKLGMRIVRLGDLAEFLRS